MLGNVFREFELENFTTNFFEKRRQLLRTIATGPALAWTGQVAAKSAKLKPVKIGQVGTKHAHAGGQASTIRKFSQHYELLGVVEPDEAQRKRMETRPEYQGVNWMTEEQLLNCSGLEAVAVETPVKDLLDVAQRCLDANLHVHLDKPAGESWNALEKLHRTASKKNRVIQMGYMFRYNPGFQFIFHAVREGWLGNIFEIHGVISKTSPASVRHKLANYEGGTMFELGCHLIDPLLHIMGPPDQVTGYIRKTRPQQDTLNDNMLAVLEYPRATATVRSALVEVSGIRRRQFVICGDKGTIVVRPLEPPELILTLAKPLGEFQSGSQRVSLPTAAGRYDGTFLDMYQVIRGEKQHDFSREHDLAVQRTILLACHLPVD